MTVRHYAALVLLRIRNLVVMLALLLATASDGAPV